MSYWWKTTTQFQISSETISLWVGYMYPTALKCNLSRNIVFIKRHHFFWHTECHSKVTNNDDEIIKIESATSSRMVHLLVRSSVIYTTNSIVHYQKLPVFDWHLESVRKCEQLCGLSVCIEISVVNAYQKQHAFCNLEKEYCTVTCRSHDYFGDVENTFLCSRNM